MKKLNFHALLIAIILPIIVLVSCKKDYIGEKAISNTTNDEYSTVKQFSHRQGEFLLHEYSIKLMQDTGFVKFLRDFTYSIYNIGQHIESDSTQPDGLFFINEEMAEFHLDGYSSAWGQFADDNKDFFQLNNEEQLQVIEYIHKNWYSPEFREENPNAISILYEMGVSLAETLNSGGKYSISARINITPNELIGCALSSLAGAIGSYGQAIDDIRYIITQGWSGGALISAATSIIRNASPWWKMGSIVFGFLGCIWGVAD